MGRSYGAIEAGGTKFVCAVGSSPDDLLIERFDTTTPEKTIPNAVQFLREQNAKAKLHAIGIGSFGPIDLDTRSDSYGYITTTPKPGWSHTDFVGAVRDEFSIPIGFDTDVNAAALGEHYWGEARGLSDFLYLTIGTGIGGGGMVNGKLMHGLVHPEMGHIFLPLHPEDRYEGKCPFHDNRCFEGLASGPAVEERWGRPATDLNATHDAWTMEAHYISLALVNYICTVSPQRIIIGGGVMEQKQLFPLIHEKVSTMLHDYIQSPAIIDNIDGYIVPAGLGKRAGVLGALALAIHASGMTPDPPA
ncbi:MAG: ROK family protein [Desulfobacterales bacterium]